MGVKFNSVLLTDHSHRRLNALTGDWVIVSPNRTHRPWQGRLEQGDRSMLPVHDSNCYLCPGNVRANGARNPTYSTTYVFPNDFPAFSSDRPSETVEPNALLRAESQSGACRVVCYSPRHDLTLAQMPVAQIRGVVDTWADQVIDLEEQWRWVQVFENKGEIMGCSNPHPHGQIWATDFIPDAAAKELAPQQRWLDSRGTPLLLDYAQLEASSGERLVIQNSHWVAVVPWWAVWPFETLLLPRRCVARLPDLDNAERDSLAEILSRLLIVYDDLFETSFPYSFGWHGAPVHNAASQLHAHFYPPLLRSASVRKFMVGYELLAEAQRDITPEQAAERLRMLEKI
jgi:UDPglucose--hexose-1-phosphate uridylyltransferase